MKIFYLLMLILWSCGEKNHPKQVAVPEVDQEEDTTTNMTDSRITFLALGDSYTIGERVETSKRWPVQLRNQLWHAGLAVESPEIIAKTGWTTNELQNAIKDEDVEPPYDLVSLLIGVNNQYRGYPIEQYRTEFKELLLQALEFAGGDSTRVFVVSIPDYGVTPFAAGSDSDKIAAEIDLYNEIAQTNAIEYNIAYFDITGISREAKENPELIAEDGLHPSSEMYRRWVALIFPWAHEILDE